MAVSDTLINTLFDGRYRIIRKLGTGGMANVYLAEDQELGRRVAIKILNDRHASDDQFVERFRREAKNAAGLSHPNIVSIYDRGEAEGTYYIAMEYLDGRSLKELIVARGPAPIPIAIDYARQILAALRFAHRNGIVHRDIKPHNVLVDPEGRLKVTDFGIARAGASQMTEVGSIVGTAQYLSPEQARGAAVDQTSDLYSVGIVLYELLTGSPPFSGDTPVEIAMKHLSAAPEAPSRRRAEIPHDLDLVVLRALAKDPAERYETAEEMDADLARVGRGLAVSEETAEAATMIMSRGAATAPTAAPSRAPAATYYDYEEPARSRPIWPWLLAVLLLAGALVAGWAVYNQIQEQLNEARPVAVPELTDLRESAAVTQVLAVGLKPEVRRLPHEGTEPTFVFDQDPNAFQRIEKGNTVTIFVSTGPPKVPVPDVRGRTDTDAVETLARLGLDAKINEIYSDKDPGIVTGQSPRPGQVVVKGSRVKLNVSRGRRPLAVPGVVGQPYDTAASTLQGAGFAVARQDVDSDRPAGIVVGQDPAGNTLATPGAKVTLSVSKGPEETTVPDVTSQDEETARDILRESGFKVKVVHQTTNNPDQDGFVLSQSPPGGTQARPGTTVTITVGKFEPPPPPVP
jgi:eukaryotic-like serine/threonine-protein kinase